MTLTAACSNCAAWRAAPTMGGHASTQGLGFCSRGFFPAQGEPRCDKYEVSARFRNEIISTMLREGGPMAMPVKLVGGRKSARKLQRR